MVNSINIGSNSGNIAIRLAYYRTVYMVTRYPQVREIFVIDRFWNVLRKKFLRAVSHKNFTFSFDFFGKGLGFLIISSLLFNIVCLWN